MDKWLTVLMLFITAGCSTVELTDGPVAESDAGCADVIEATIASDGGGWTISATVASVETGWDKYADAWQVRGPEDQLLGERVLAHPHENDQPFTRSLRGVDIPEGIDTVTVAARDSVLGFCGDVFVLEVP